MAERLEAEFEMGVDGECEGEAEEGGMGNQRELGDLEFLTQEVKLSRTTIINAHNGFNKLSHLAMLWTVRHCWPEGVRLTFN